MPKSDVELRAMVGVVFGSGVVATEVTLVPGVGVAALISASEVASAANFGFRFLATGRAIDNGVSAIVHQGLALHSSPREGIMAFYPDSHRQRQC